MGAYSESGGYRRNPRQNHRRRRKQRRNVIASEVRRRLYVDEVFGRENLFRVFRKLKNDPTAPGIDKIGVEQISEAEGAENCGRLSELIERNEYMPGRVRSQPIPKQRVGVRMLNLPTILDRIVARAAHEAISPYAEAVFDHRSYGFRPKRTSWSLLAHIVRETDGGNRPFIGNFDIEKAFDQVLIEPIINAFGKLLTSSAVKHIIAPQRWLALLRTILTGGTKRRRGIGQGNPLSPLALNVVLNELLDQRLAESALSAWFRWADNLYFLAGAKSEITHAHSLALRGLEPLGVGLRGKCHYLCDGSIVPILGFDVLMSFSRIQVRVNQAAWEKLSKDLPGVHNSVDPPTRLREVLAGWLAAYGPGLRNVDRVTERLMTIAESTTQLSPCREELQALARKSYRRWESLLRRQLNKRPPLHVDAQRQSISRSI